MAPRLPGDHELMSHIVCEGFRKRDGDLIPFGPTVADGIQQRSVVRALCGKAWVPGRDPSNYPLCESCRAEAEAMGWEIPQHG
jgi:hypothetical protein